MTFPPGVPPGVPDPAPSTESPWPAGWELVHDEPGEQVRRFRVFGGWLYQVKLDNFHAPIAAEPGVSIYGWHPPVFVPEGRPQFYVHPGSNP